MGHTTDAIVENMRAIAPAGGSPREEDLCLCAGEQISAGLMALALQSLGREAASLTGWQAGILTDGCHGSARILGLSNDRICRELEQGRIVVVAGFQGVTADGQITTLGRGGSDTTAVALAAYLRSDRCQIFTDVDGVYDRDPRIFMDAVRFERIGYEQMMSLIENGAQVLHDRSVKLAQERGITVEVLSAFTGQPGTIVG
jgi:aspartate kinase